MDPLSLKPRTSLELLPPEMLCQILQSIADPKTLFNLIRASPQSFQVFRQFRSATLCQMTLNFIPAEVLPIAIELLARGRFRGQKLDRDEVAKFLNVFSHPIPLFDEEFSLETAIELLSFHKLVKRFMVEFSSERLAIITKYFHPDLSNNISINASLTRTEELRLSRAFYHLELYGLLFRPSHTVRDVTTITVQSANFLGKITEGQLEALLCVRTFLLERLTGFLKKLEEDFMEDFLSLGPHPFHNSRSSRWENNDWFFAEDIFPLLQETWRENCLTRGLYALRIMFNASTAEDRLNAVGNTAFQVTTISAALQLLQEQGTVEESSRETNPDLQTPLTGDEWEICTEAWSWAQETTHRQVSEARGVKDPHVEGLRRWGYIIWDQSRLEDLGVLKLRYVASNLLSLISLASIVGLTLFSKYTVHVMLQMLVI